MADLPRGTVTLLFTDIAGSTQLLRRLGKRYAGSVWRQVERLWHTSRAGKAGVLARA